MFAHVLLFEWIRNHLELQISKNRGNQEGQLLLLADYGDCFKSMSEFVF